MLAYRYHVSPREIRRCSARDVAAMWALLQDIEDEADG